jgi:hypothetical protein
MIVKSRYETMRHEEIEDGNLQSIYRIRAIYTIDNGLMANHF